MPGALQADSIGPVDVAIIGFDGNEFHGDLAPALVDLADSGVVRIIDISFVRKGPDGVIAVVEAADEQVGDAFERLTGSQFDLLSDEDLAEVAEGLSPGSSAMVIVWENSWAARLATAVRASRGSLMALERVPHDQVVAAIAALDQDEE